MAHENGVASGRKIPRIGNLQVRRRRASGQRKADPEVLPDSASGRGLAAPGRRPDSKGRRGHSPFARTAQPASGGQSSRTVHLFLSISADTHARWATAAAREDLQISVWIRWALTREIRHRKRFTTGCRTKFRAEAICLHCSDRSVQLEANTGGRLKLHLNPEQSRRQSSIRNALRYDRSHAILIEADSMAKAAVVHHEARHSVAVAVLGIPPRYASVRPRRRAVSHIGRPVTYSGPRTDREKYDHIVVSLARPAAERHRRRGTSRCQLCTSGCSRNRAMGRPRRICQACSRSSPRCRPGNLGRSRRTWRQAGCGSPGGRLRMRP